MRCTPPVLTAIVALVLALPVAPAFANRATADACAARLPADAKLIYAVSIGTVAPGADLAGNVRAKTRELVMAGKLDRAQAQSAAEAAGACLKQAL